MKATVTDREYLSFTEAQSYLDCSDNDLRAWVTSGRLKPSVFMAEPCTLLQWGQDESDSANIGDLEPVPILDHEGADILVATEGWYFLQQPRSTGPFDCSFSLISEGVHPETSLGCGTHIYGLSRTITMSDVQSKCVFMVAELQRFNAERGQPPSLAEDKPLKTRERNNLLALIGVLAHLAKIDNTKTSKAAQGIEAVANDLGVKLPYTTILNHLKAAAEAMDGKKK